MDPGIEPAGSRLSISATDSTADALASFAVLLEAEFPSSSVRVHDKGLVINLAEGIDPADVSDLLSATVNLEFRPVLGFLGPELSEQQRAEFEVAADDLRTELGLPPGTTAETVIEQELAAVRAALAADPQAPPPPGPQNEWGIDVSSSRFQELAAIDASLDSAATPTDQIDTFEEATLADTDGNLYRLGPVHSSADRLLNGQSIESASAGLNEQDDWVVNPVLREGPGGIELFNELAALCFEGAPECPAQQGERGQLAVVLDGQVLTAPSINNTEFQRDQIEISGSFDEQGSRAVALGLTIAAGDFELD